MKVFRALLAEIGQRVTTEGRRVGLWRDVDIQDFLALLAHWGPCP